MFTFGQLFNYRQLRSARQGRASRLVRLALVLTGAGLQAQAQSGFALSPMRVELNLAAGAQRTGTVTLANPDPASARFRTEILDLSIDKEAVPQFETAITSEAEFTCKNWVTVNPMEADIAGRHQMPIRYTFRIPADVPPRTYHCALGFTSLPDPRSHTAALGIMALLRLTSTFYITVGNPHPAGEVKQISIEKIGTGVQAGYRALINVQNSGLTNLRGAGSVDIVNEGGEVVQTGEFPPVVILPSRTQRLPVALGKNLTNGNYTLRARVNLGNGEIQDAELRFRLPTKE